MDSYPYKHYYLFKGSWLDRFDELIQKNNAQNFELWEPKNKSRKLHLIVLSGKPLSDTFCIVKKVFQTDEETFHYFFRPCISEFHVHKFGEVNAVERIEDNLKDKLPEFFTTSA